MKKKPAYDYTRMEKEPPRVPEPWAVVRLNSGRFALLREGLLMKECLAQSEDGAHREGMIFIKAMDF